MLSLLFLAGTNWWDGLITAVEATQQPPAPVPLASHVALTRPDGTGIEAAFPRVRPYQANPALLHRTRVYIVPLTPAQEQVVWATAQAHLGDWYDLPAWLRTGWYVWSGRTDAWFEDDRAFVDCSSLVVTCLRAAGVDPFPGIPASNVTPSALEVWVRDFCSPRRMAAHSQT